MVMILEDVSFSSGGDTCAAWLYPAASDAGARPVIVMAHGLTGTRRDRLGAFADRFAAAGIAALVFDHRGFGDSMGEPDLFHPARQLDDWRGCLARPVWRPYATPFPLRSDHRHTQCNGWRLRLRSQHYRAHCRVLGDAGADSAGIREASCASFGKEYLPLKIG